MEATSNPINTPVDDNIPVVDTLPQSNCIITPAQQSVFDLLALAARLNRGVIILPPSGSVTPETGWYICATGTDLARGMELQLLHRMKTS